VVTERQEVLEKARQAVGSVCDPEIPSLSIMDLGIVRSIDDRDGELVVKITPTYSGCPALHTIEREIREALRHAGIPNFRIEKTLTPAWTTEWITENGRKKLSEAGIAPPGAVMDIRPVILELVTHQVECPQCGSHDTTVTSEFGSTSCKAFYHCSECLSTFEYFKPI
jgi:ring-1,2-phenylacetyl-CoA epoxidase subunit PaaD